MLVLPSELVDPVVDCRRPRSKFLRSPRRFTFNRISTWPTENTEETFQKIFKSIYLLDRRNNFVMYCAVN